MPQKVGIWLVVLLAVLAFYFHYPYLFELPNNFHAWAQSDHYGIALGFLRNGHDLMHPECFILNKQFPSGFGHQFETAITAVDFPIHNWIVSILMRILGTTSPAVFYIYTLISGGFGLYFLWKLVFNLTGKKFNASLVTILLGCSPVYLWYQAGTLPTIPSLTLTIVGIYLYQRFLSNKNSNFFVGAFFFLTIAALNRTPFAIPGIAIGGLSILKMIRQRRWNPTFVITIITSGAVLFAMQYHNAQLRAAHGSLFLNYPLPAPNLQSFLEIIHETYDWRRFDYFSLPQYILIGSALVVGLLVFRKRARSTFFKLPFVQFLGIYLLGVIAYSLLMVQQFPNHDYYFLDTLALPILLAFGLLTNFLILPNKGWPRATMILVFIGLFSFSNWYFIQNRRKPISDDETQITHVSYKDADKLMAELGVDLKSKVLVFHPTCTPNLPLIYLNRIGSVIMENDNHHLFNSINWDYDVLVISNHYHPRVLKAFPGLIDQFVRIGRNKGISVFKKKTPNLAHLPGFEEIYEGEVITQLFHNGDNEWINSPCGYLQNISSEQEFLINNHFGLLPAFLVEQTKLKVEFDLHAEQMPNDLHFVVSGKNDKENAFYHAEKITKKGKQTYYVTIPRLDPTYEAVQFYIWNQGHNNCQIENLTLTLLSN